MRHPLLFEKLGEAALEKADESRALITRELRVAYQLESRWREDAGRAPVVREPRLPGWEVREGLQLGQCRNVDPEVLQRFAEGRSLIAGAVEGAVCPQGFVEPAGPWIGQGGGGRKVEWCASAPDPPDAVPVLQYAPSRKEMAAGTTCRASAGVRASWRTTAGAV